MLLDFATNPRGTTYAYLVCSGRAAKTTNCTRRAVPVQVAERLVEDSYASISISEDDYRSLAAHLADDEQLRPHLAEPFATIYREAHAGGDDGKEAKPEHTTSIDVACSHKTTWVELRGLEPLTPCMPCRCATSCATAPRCSRERVPS